MNNKELKGMFYLPTDPTFLCHGDLKINEDMSISLSLYERLEQNINQVEFVNYHMEYCNHDVIKGDLYDGKSVVLLFSSFGSMSLMPHLLVTYNCRYVLFNQEFAINSKDDLYFKKVSFRFPWIELLLGASKVDHNWDDHNLKVEAVDAKELYHINDNVTMILSYDWSYSDNGTETHTVTSKTTIDFEFKDNEYIEDITNIHIYNLSLFFSILTGNYRCPEGIQIKIDREDSNYPLLIECCYDRFSNYDNKQPSRPHRPFKFRLLKPHLSLYLQRFYNLISEYRYTFSNYTFELFQCSPRVISNFVTVVSTLESLLCFLDKTPFFTSQEDYKANFYDPIKDFIYNLSSLDDNEVFKNQMIKRLQTGFVKSLATYLNDHMNLNKNIFDYLFDDKRAKIPFKISDYRNSFVHLRDDPFQNSKKFDSFYRTNMHARVLLDVLVYKEIGIPDDIVLAVIRDVYNSYVKQEYQTGTGLRRPTLPIESTNK